MTEPVIVASVLGAAYARLGHEVAELEALIEVEGADQLDRRHNLIKRHGSSSWPSGRSSSADRGSATTALPS